MPIQILVAEDESIVAHNLQHRLQNLGYMVPAAVHTGEEAIDYVAALRPDLVLMDIRLAGELDGVTAAGHIRSQFDIPVIYLTAYADEETLQRAKVTEPYGYILKPFDLRNLQITIEMALYKHKMEQAIKARERWFATTLMSIGDAVITSNTAGHITLLNAVAEKLTGWTNEAARGRNVSQIFMLINEETRAPIENPALRLLRSEAPMLAAPALLVAKDGVETPIECTMSPIRDDHGTLLGAVLVFRDITERRKAEKALRASEERLRAVVGGALAVFFAVDTDGVITLAEGQELERGGTSPGALLGQSFYAHYHDYPDLIDAFQRTLRGQVTSWSGTIDERTYDTRMMPLRDSNHNVSGVIGVSFDITARKQADEERLALERKLLEAQKLESLGVLAGGIAHDFNNLLSVVLGNASLAMVEVFDNERAYDSLQEIEVAAQRAAALVRQLQAYAGQGQIAVQPLALNNLLTEMSALLRASIGRNIDLQYQLEPRLPTIMADHGDLRQVVLNLVVNASEAMSEGEGTITITTRATHIDSTHLTPTYMEPSLSTGLYVILEVADTGHGMDSVTIDRIFDPFFTTKFTGRGLGLAAVLGIVRGHRGAVRVQSRLGGGTVFTILLPGVTALQEAPPARLEDVTTWRGNGTILVVDDEPGVRAVVTQALERSGFTVLTAADGLAALDVFRAHADEIICVLLDLTMPHMNGKDTLHAIRTIRSDARIVMMSGYYEEEVASQFTDNELTGFLQKPFMPAELRAKLRAILNGALR
jgi:PAS domain S-box-containing protein